MTTTFAVGIPKPLWMTAAGWEAKTTIQPAVGPVSVYARVVVWALQDITEAVQALVEQQRIANLWGVLTRYSVPRTLCGFCRENWTKLREGIEYPPGSFDPSYVTYIT